MSAAERAVSPQTPESGTFSLRPAPRGEAPRRARRLTPSKPLPFERLLGPALLLGAWCAGSASGAIDPRILTEPWHIADAVAELWSDGRLARHLLASSRRAALGLGFGVVAAVLLALAAGLTRIGEAVIDGPLQMKRAIPTLALIPLLILWFGVGEEMKVLTIALAVVYPVYINTHAGLRGIDARYVELAETLGLGRAEFVRRVALPGALPGFLMGLRLAVTASWLALVVVEQINATTGIGYMMSLARSYGQTEIIVVGLLVYGAFGLSSDSLVRWVERRALSWRRTFAS